MEETHPEPSSVAMRRGCPKGCPRWKGMHKAPLLCTPGAALQGGEDHRGLVQAGLKCRAASLPGSSLQQVHVEPGRWWKRGASNREINPTPGHI